MTASFRGLPRRLAWLQLLLQPAQGAFAGLNVAFDLRQLDFLQECLKARPRGQSEDRLEIVTGDEAWAADHRQDSATINLPQPAGQLSQRDGLGRWPRARMGGLGRADRQDESPQDILPEVFEPAVHESERELSLRVEGCQLQRPPMVREQQSYI